MRRTTRGLAAALALLAGAAAAQDAAPPPDDTTGTALDLHQRDTRMTVAVTLNGAGPFRFVVDSGATRTVVSSRLATLLGLPAAGAVRLNSVGGTAMVPTVRIAALGLGEMPARAIVAPVLEERDLGAAGILGIDALADRKVVIDLRRNRMTVEPGDRAIRQAASDEIVVVARRRYGQLVFADADAAGQPILAVIDTGGMATIGNGLLRERLVRRRRAAPIATIITDVAGNEMPAAFAPIGTVRIGGFSLENPLVAFSDTQTFAHFGLDRRPSMLVGMDMMRSFDRVAIDFRRRTVRFTKRA